MYRLLTDDAAASAAGAMDAIKIVTKAMASIVRNVVILAAVVFVGDMVANCRDEERAIIVVVGSLL